MPELPGPEGLRSLADLLGHIDHPAAQHIAHQRPIEQRPVEEATFLSPSPGALAEQQVWMRALGALPDDPLIHAAVLAYASDYSLLDPVLRRHGLVWGDPRLRVASLDHSMWFHRAVAADRWFLYVQESPSASNGRGLGIGQMFQDGQLVATTAQEGMVRVKEVLSLDEWSASASNDGDVVAVEPDARLIDDGSPAPRHEHPVDHEPGEGHDLGPRAEVADDVDVAPVHDEPAVVLIDVHHGGAQVPRAGVRLASAGLDQLPVELEHLGVPERL